MCVRLLSGASAPLFLRRSMMPMHVRKLRRSGAQRGQLLLVQEGRGPCVGSPSTQTGRSFAVPPPPAPSPPAPVTGTAGAAAVQEIVDAAERYALAADPNPQRVEARVCTIYGVR